MRTQNLALQTTFPIKLYHNSNFDFLVKFKLSLLKAIVFKSLRLNCSDIIQIMSTTVSKTLTYYLIQLYLLIK